MRSSTFCRKYLLLPLCCYFLIYVITHVTKDKRQNAVSQARAQPIRLTKESLLRQFSQGFSPTVSTLVRIKINAFRLIHLKHASIVPEWSVGEHDRGRKDENYNFQKGKTAPSAKQMDTGGHTVEIPFDPRALTERKNHPENISTEKERRGNFAQIEKEEGELQDDVGFGESRKYHNNSVQHTLRSTRIDRNTSSGNDRSANYNETSDMRLNQDGFEDKTASESKEEGRDRLAIDDSREQEGVDQERDLERKENNANNDTNDRENACISNVCKLGGVEKEPQALPPHNPVAEKPLTQQFNWISFVDPHTYSYILKPHNACDVNSSHATHEITLLVLIHSAPKNFIRRSIIRGTWLKAATFNRLPVKALFLLGRTNEANLQIFITNEADRFGDIIQEDFMDSYLNLTIKTMMGLRWASTFCPNASFVMKTDDDVMLNIFNLTKDLSAAPKVARKNTVIGRKLQNSQPIRDITHKWYTPVSIYPNDTYPPYPEGHVYIMSLDVAKRLLEASVTAVPLFPWEDVYIGMLLQKIGESVTDLPATFLSHCLRGRSELTGADNAIIQSLNTLYTLQHGYFWYDLYEDEMNKVWRAIESQQWPFLEKGGCDRQYVSNHERLPDIWLKMENSD